MSHRGMTTSKEIQVLDTKCSMCDAFLCCGDVWVLALDMSNSLDEISSTDTGDVELSNRGKASTLRIVLNDSER